jgi:prepilin-type N-terminal cleavage/methylation domain-containing protein
MKARPMKATAPFQSSRRARRAGYTAVEVLVALTLFAVGTASVLSLQRASIIGSSDARRTDVGTAIAAEWVERLREDSFGWPFPDGGATLATQTSGTRYLTVAQSGPDGTSTSGADTDWFVAPIPATAGALDDSGSPIYDIVGRPLTNSAADLSVARFCTQYRLQYVSYDDSGALPAGKLMRAEVRVLQCPDGGPITCTGTTAGVSTATLCAGATGPARAISMTVTLRQN